MGEPRHGKAWWQDVTAPDARRVLNFLQRWAPTLASLPRQVAHPTHRQALAVLNHHHRYSIMLWQGVLASAENDHARASLIKRALSSASPSP